MVRYDVKQQKRSWLRARTEEENTEFDEEELHLKLQTLQDQLLSTKPFSSLNSSGDEHDDLDLHPLSLEREPRDFHNGRYISETSFWTGEDQKHRSASMRSGSSSMNSSLHGTPSFDHVGLAPCRPLNRESIEGRSREMLL